MTTLFVLGCAMVVMMVMAGLAVAWTAIRAVLWLLFLPLMLLKTLFGLVFGLVFGALGLVIGLVVTLAVVVIVLILGVICYFSVDVARRVLIRPPLDPPDAGNGLEGAWSFEAHPPPGEEGAVPGWKVHAGDRGRISAGSEFAQYPGRQALHLAGEGGAGALTRAVFERPLAVRAGARYRLGGFVRNQGAFASGFVASGWGAVG